MGVYQCISCLRDMYMDIHWRIGVYILIEGHFRVLDFRQRAEGIRVYLCIGV